MEPVNETPESASMGIPESQITTEMVESFTTETTSTKDVEDGSPQVSSTTSIPGLKPGEAGAPVDGSIEPLVVAQSEIVGESMDQNCGGRCECNFVVLTDEWFGLENLVLTRP